MNTQVQRVWQDLYQGKVARDLEFRPLDEDPSELLTLLAAHFTPGVDGRTLLTRDLSDGLRSLFSLSLFLGLFRVEQAIAADSGKSGFDEALTHDFPHLTVFAVEEPENHLSPHYLGSVVHQLAAVADHPNAQVLLSSHSPAILGRVQPDDVRYFLGDEHSSSTSVKHIPLPEDESDEAFKYVREAVRSHPELYFSRLVIFGEGPSEEIVLKRVFEASGTPLDSHFISIVPLGGRHINHFWKLVHGLGIPHLTLLDLDREKEGAGWGRIQYVRDELVARVGKKSKKLQFSEGSPPKEKSLADTEYDTLSEHDVTNLEAMQEWISWFETEFDVFFSVPLDLDFAMLERYPKTYKRQSERGPRLPKAGSDGYERAVQRRVAHVLASNPAKASPDLGATYSASHKELFPWYKHLFVDGSKPVAHMRAMVRLSDDRLLGRLPSFLKRLIDRAKQLTSHS